jgi:hypothetical protein
MTSTKEWLPSEKDIENYDLLCGMLGAQRVEFDLLSKKKPNEELNKTKIKMLNRILEPLNKLLSHEDSHQFLDVLVEDNMPTYSDVVLIISQYETATQEFKDKYYKKDEHQSNTIRTIKRWMTKEYPPDFYESETDEEDDYED